MKDKLNQFVANLNGQFVEVSDSTNRFQCMDLAYCWVFALGFPKATIQNLYAYQAYTNPKDITYQYFDLIPNTPDGVPQDGDIVVFSNKLGVAGHIGVALGGGTTSKFKIFEQNYPLGTNAHITERTYTNVLGWLRPKLQEAGTPEPNWFKQLLLEKNLSLDREGEFRVFWEKAIKYDNDTNTLKEQVKSANEALADRASEVSLLTEKNQKLSDKVTEVEELLNKLRSDKDTLTWEKAQLEVKVDTLVSENTALQEKVTHLEGQTPLKGYTWFERFISLFKR